MIDVHRVRPEEFSEAGRATALAWSHIPPDQGMRAFLARVADIAGRAATASVFVATLDGEILGSVTLELANRGQDADNPASLAAGECHVRMLGVNPQAKRRGVARALMRHCIETARAAGMATMTLNTSDQNAAAAGLYESMGFVRDPDITSTFGSHRRKRRLEQGNGDDGDAPNVRPPDGGRPVGPREPTRNPPMGGSAEVQLPPPNGPDQSADSG